MNLRDSHKEPLTADMIPEPGLYNLTLLIRPDSLDALVSSRVDDGVTIHRRFDYAPGSDPVAALEETVYDNPLLVSDFHDVRVVVDNDRFFVMDASDVTESELKRRIECLWPDSRRDTELQPLVSEIESEKNVLVSAVERPLMAFVNRTWNNPAAVHRMAVLARFHVLRNKMGNMGKIHVHLHENSTDIVVCGRSGILLVNSFATRTVEDAAYYALAVASHLSFDNESDRVLVNGPAALRDSFTALMRRFIPFVMPEIKPSAIASLPADIPVELPISRLI